MDLEKRNKIVARLQVKKRAVKRVGFGNMEFWFLEGSTLSMLWPGEELTETKMSKV